MILQAKRRQEQARVRLMNLEVARRTLWLLMMVIGAVGLLLGLMGETGFNSLSLWR